MAERGAGLDHATLSCWVSKYTGLVAAAARCRKRAVGRSWRMDETYVKVKSEWVYLYRAIDKNGVNSARIKAINEMPKSFGCPIPTEMVRRKYLNYINEQDHRFIKRRIGPMLDFKPFASAASALASIELINMIRKGQFTPRLSPFQQFAQLAG